MKPKPPTFSQVEADLNQVKLKPEEVRRLLKEDAEHYTPVKPWEPWENEILREFSGKVPRHKIAKRLNRTVNQVSHQIERIGGSKPRGQMLAYPKSGKSERQ